MGAWLVLAMGLVPCGIVGAAENAAAPGAAKIKEMLGTGGWTAEWWYTKQGNTTTYPYKVRFETRAGKFGADQRESPKGDCFKEVKLKADGFTYLGCMGNPFEIRYDPNDPKYPFKGDSSFTSIRFTSAP